MYKNVRATPNGYVMMGGASNYVSASPTIANDDSGDVSLNIRDDTAHYLQPRNGRTTGKPAVGNGHEADVTEPLLLGGVELRDRPAPPGGRAEQPPTYSVCMADT